MGNAHARHHPRNADGLCYGSDGTDLRRGNTRPFQFLGDRCAATSARASGGGENHPLHIVLFQGLGNGRAEGPAVFKGSAVACGGIDIIGQSTRRVDVRIICATNSDLLARMRGQAFRSDLYYRLSVVSLSDISNPW